ncbi:iron-sulfur cluster assembly accessory protein [Blochmannia endosymbiont of Camponotus (Colobopsis) obliquus]|uniref:iron-sulfur cluster assembly accessory protein n=1 Tax=Blochmannia endosymbiont of Camponotus (Colobopsis) obliquus TaxID=1505597 RepID=UPI00061A8221|nr:iron-sulfur cluster assembly accessory protein [Blochmannia endosymbiont of Camponotus (Colobopsis) obliquus]AKC60521.1 protein sufA [Blochmannia endosymbiont of Camponotus (Colobopsis) obliquus]
MTINLTRKNNSIILPKKNTWQGLNVSNAAIKQIKYLMKQHIDMLGLRIDIRKYGCAGFGYIVDKATISNKKDLVYEYNGAKLFVSLKAMPFIDGTQLDYVKEGLNYMFKFDNPQVQFICGCGHSFNV